MPTAADKRFPRKTATAVQESQVIGIRAGVGDHRIIGIWAVVVEGRVFVRSWSLKPRSWYRTFLEDPRGVMTIANRELPVRAVQTRSERLRDAVSLAYLAKYKTPGALKYARDLGRAKSRATTTELVPASSRASAPASAGLTAVAKAMAVRRPVRRSFSEGGSFERRRKAGTTAEARRSRSALRRPADYSR